MKFIAKVFLILFITFLITPTVVSVLEKSADVSVFYNMSEEENVHKVFKEFCAIPSSNEIFHLIPYYSSLIISENLSKHDKISSKIFIPPPDLA